MKSNRQGILSSIIQLRQVQLPQKACSLFNVLMNAKLFWAGILVLHAIAFLWQFYNQNLYTLDSPGYLYAAHNLATKGILYVDNLNDPIDSANFTMRPPLYPLFIAAIKTLAAPDLFIVLFQNVVSIFNIWLALQGLYLLFKINRPPLLIFCLVVIYPAQLIYANVVMSEILFQTCIISMVFCMVNFFLFKRPFFLILYTLALVAGILTKPVLFPFGFINSVLMIGVCLMHRKWYPILISAIPLLAILFYSSWNFQRTGSFQFSSVTTFNALHINCAYLLRNVKGPDYAERFIDSIDQEGAKRADFGQRQRLFAATAKQQIQKNLPAFIMLSIKGMANFFLDPGRYDLYLFTGRTNDSNSSVLLAFTRYGYLTAIQMVLGQQLHIVLVLFATFIGNCAKFVLLCACIFNRKISLEVRMFFVVFVAYFSAITGMLGTSRFAVPLFPVLLITSYAGLHYLQLFFSSINSTTISPQATKNGG